GEDRRPRDRVLERPHGRVRVRELRQGHDRRRGGPVDGSRLHGGRRRRFRGSGPHPRIRRIPLLAHLHRRRREPRAHRGQGPAGHLHPRGGLRMTTTRTPLMAGNWKMNLDWKQGLALVEELKRSDTDKVAAGVLPPFVHIPTAPVAVAAGTLPIAYGAQDLSAHDSGAYTGEVSGPMLKALGASYVAVGHSERRQYHGED